MGFGSIVSGIGSALKVAGSAVKLGQSVIPQHRDGSPDWTAHQEGIRWRVADAKAAGVHPLAALGANIAQPVVSGQSVTGSGTGEAIAQLGTSFGGAGKHLTNKRAQAAETARINAQAESGIRLNESQTMLNIARSRSIQAEIARNPTLTREALDMSMVVDPTTGRTTMVNTPAGWHRLDPSTVPTEVMEREYGELGDLVYGPARYTSTTAKTGQEGQIGLNPIDRLRLRYSNP